MISKRLRRVFTTAARVRPTWAGCSGARAWRVAVGVAAPGPGQPLLLASHALSHACCRARAATHPPQTRRTKSRWCARSRTTGSPTRMPCTPWRRTGSPERSWVSGSTPQHASGAAQGRGSRGARPLGPCVAAAAPPPSLRSVRAPSQPPSQPAACSERGRAGRQDVPAQREGP